MAKNNIFTHSRSPATVAGFLCALLLAGCQTATPEDVTLKFWQALAQGQLDQAKKHVTPETQSSIKASDIDKLSPIKTNDVFADDLNATVMTTISRNNRQVTFNTILRKDTDGWKVDAQQTHISIAMIPFDGLVKSLQGLGENFAKQMELQMPAIEKQLESLGNNMKNQIEEFGRALEKQSTIPAPPKRNPGTI